MTADRTREIDRTVAKRIGEVMSRSFAMTSVEARMLFDSLAIELMELATTEDIRNEIARRIVEAKISVLFDKLDDQHSFDTSWTELEALGFADLEREASALVYRIKRLLLLPARAREADSALDRLQVVIARMTSEGERGLADHFGQVLTSLRL